MNKACKIGVLLINIVNNRKIELNKFFEGFKTFFSHMFIGTSFSLRSNCVNVPKLANPRKKIRNVVLTSVRTASMYLSSLTFAKVHRKKPPDLVAFMGDYYEKV